jgi:hypothetical protein
MRTTVSPRRRVVSLAVFLGLGLVLGFRHPAAAQTTERTIFASVLDAEGKPLTSVTPDDLVVREDGVRREVLRVTPATDPMQVAVLVDNTAAASAQISNIRDGLTAFVKKLAGKHEVSLVTFADRPTLLVEATTDAPALERGIGRVFSQSGSGSYLVDAIDEVSKGFKKRGATRPVIVVVTLEGREFSNSPYQLVLERLAESGAALHAIVLTSGRGPLTQEERDRAILLDKGTREHGGERHDVLSGMAIPQELTRLADELLAQQKVVYARPGSLIPPKATTIEGARPGVKVRGALAPLPPAVSREQ